MSMRIVVKGDQHEVETKPLTLICHKDDIRISIPECVEIGPEQTVARANAISETEWEQLRDFPIFVKLWQCVFPKIEPPLTLKGEGLGYRHVVGLIILLVETARSGKQPFIRFPESYLHPSAQLGLADLFIMLTNKNA